MSENFFVEIISPNQSILKSEAVEVTIPSYEGQLGILKDHVSLITFLRPGLIIIKTENDEKKFFIEEGIVEFKNNNLLILTSTSKSLESLDKSVCPAPVLVFVISSNNISCRSYESSQRRPGGGTLPGIGTGGSLADHWQGGGGRLGHLQRWA